MWIFGIGKMGYRYQNAKAFKHQQQQQQRILIHNYKSTHIHTVSRVTHDTIAQTNWQFTSEITFVWNMCAIDRSNKDREINPNCFPSITLKLYVYIHIKTTKKHNATTFLYTHFKNTLNRTEERSNTPIHHLYKTCTHTHTFIWIEYATAHQPITLSKKDWIRRFQSKFNSTETWLWFTDINWQRQPVRQQQFADLLEFRWNLNSYRTKQAINQHQHFHPKSAETKNQVCKHKISVILSRECNVSHL